MQSFCSTNGLTISIPKTEVVVFGGGHCNASGMWGAIASSVVNVSYILACCFMRTGTSNTQSSIAWLEAMYVWLGCANSVQLLLRLQQAILQPCASYVCEVWAPASACIGPFRELEQLQSAFLRRACRVKKSIPADIIFQELQQMRWHDFWWRRVTSFWSALVEADAGSLHSMIFHDAIQLALAGCKFSWAAQVFKCFSTLVSPCL